MWVIMKTNIFQFGVLYFLQLLGTAMGTSTAVMWATLYFAWHEHHCLLSKYASNLLYYKRYIDDIIAVWLGDRSTWTNFCADLNNFGILTWEIQEPSLSVDFLDLTLTLVNGKIETKTFQKALNLYLYIPPSSAHPPGCIKGTIYGLIGRFYASNTHRKDYVYFITLLFGRLLKRGWDAAFLKPLFLQACESIESRSRDKLLAASSEALETPKTSERSKKLFLHLQYHRDNVPRQRIRALYDQHLSNCQVGAGH